MRPTAPATLTISASNMDSCRIIAAAKKGFTPRASASAAISSRCGKG